MEREHEARFGRAVGHSKRHQNCREVNDERAVSEALQ